MAQQDWRLDLRETHLQFSCKTFQLHEIHLHLIRHWGLQLYNILAKNVRNYVDIYVRMYMYEC